MKRPAHSTRAETALAAKISRLRELLLTSEDLAEPSNYFHEMLVPDDTFMAACWPYAQPRLLEIVGAMLRSRAPEARPAKPMVLRCAAHRLCHGCIRWGKGFALFVYFEELDTGFCSYQQDLLDPNVWFMRFSVRPASGWPMTRQRGSA